MLKTLGVATSSLSLLALAWKGFDLELGPTLIAVLEQYERGMHLLFVLAEPVITATLAYINAWFGWDLHLLPHWKHVFALMWLYFGSFARSIEQSGAKLSAAVHAVFGGVVAIIFGAASGTVPLANPSMSVLFGLFPVIGVTFYELCWRAIAVPRNDPHRGATWLRVFFRDYARFPLQRGYVGIVGLLVGTQLHRIPILKEIPNPSLAVLAVLVVTFALMWIWQGARYAGRSDESWPKPNEWWQLFRGDGRTRIGFLMLASISTATGTVFLNSLLAQYGL